MWCEGCYAVRLVFSVVSVAATGRRGVAGATDAPVVAWLPVSISEDLVCGYNQPVVDF